MKMAVLVYIQFYRTRNKINSHANSYTLASRDSVVSWASLFFLATVCGEEDTKTGLVSVSDGQGFAMLTGR